MGKSRGKRGLPLVIRTNLTTGNDVLVVRLTNRSHATHRFLLQQDLLCTACENGVSHHFAGLDMSAKMRASMVISVNKQYERRCCWVRLTNMSHAMRRFVCCAKQGSDSACTWRFILPGMTLRAWRDFALIPCEHAEWRLHAAQHREMPLAVNKAAHAQHL